MKKLAVFGAGLAAATGMTGGQAAAEGSDEAQKQATRLISQAITERIAARTDLSIGLSDDSERAIWGITNISKLGAGEGMKNALDTSGSGGDVEFDMDLGLFSGGYDGRSGERTILGVNISAYAVSGDMTIAGTGFDMDSETSGYGVSAAPYVAYKVTDNFFLATVVGFNISSTTSDSSSSFTIPGLGTTTTNISSTVGSTALFSDISANLVQKLGPVTLREKALYRTNYSVSDVEGAEAVLSSSVGIAGEAEVNMGRHAAFYLGAETTYQADDDIAEARYPVFVGAGLTIRPRESMQFSAGYQTEFGDDYSDISSFLLQGRIKFGPSGSARRNAETQFADDGLAPRLPNDPYAANADAYDQAPTYQFALAQPLPADPAPAYQEPAPAYQQSYQPPAYQEPAYQQPAPALYQAPAVLTTANVDSARLEFCRMERDQRMAERENQRSNDPNVDAYTFRLIFDDYERCAAGA